LKTGCRFQVAGFRLQVAGFGFFAWNLKLGTWNHYKALDPFHSIGSEILGLKVQIDDYRKVVG
jgi:hypothetical protein